MEYDSFKFYLAKNLLRLFYSDQDVLLWQHLIKELSVLEHYRADGGAGLTTFNITSIEKYTNEKRKKIHKEMAVLISQLSIFH